MGTGNFPFFHGAIRTGGSQANLAKWAWDLGKHRLRNGIYTRHLHSLQDPPFRTLQELNSSLCRLSMTRPSPCGHWVRLPVHRSVSGLFYLTWISFEICFVPLNANSFFSATTNIFGCGTKGSMPGRCLKVFHCLCKLIFPSVCTNTWLNG